MDKAVITVIALEAVGRGCSVSPRTRCRGGIVALVRRRRPADALAAHAEGGVLHPERIADPLRQGMPERHASGPLDSAWPSPARAGPTWKAYGHFSATVCTVILESKQL